ncbi:MAG TPA: AsmA family protein, partial [Methyloceanibacter sp.]|nr:AsmA family protein [Methyloceanibacter sp.]
MNALLLTLTALLILVLSALFAAPLVIDWNDYRPVFETQAAKLLGRQVKVGGQVHLVLLPAPELRFDDIKVANQDGSFDKPFLEARSVEAGLNIGALLSGGIEARRIAILDPVLRLDLKADGSANWSDVGRRGVGLPFAPKDVMLDSVSVGGGKIEITKEGAPRFTLEDIAGEASAAALSGPYKVSATYSLEGRPQELRFSTSEPDAAGLLRIKSALRDIERNTTYVLDGRVTGLGGKPVYDGTILVRVANASTDEFAADDTDAASEEPPAGERPTATAEPSPNLPAAKDMTSLFELKGALTATTDHAELPDFELTIPAKGHPQMLKGKLIFDFAERLKAMCELSASFVDLDALFVPGSEHQSSPAAVLYMLADEALGETAELGGSTLNVAIEQAGLGGDLIGTLDLALAAKQGTLTIGRLKAVLPGGNRIEASGLLSRGEFGPVFAGPIKLEGSGLRALTRWAAGDRDMSGQAATSDFVLAANATVGDGELKLADATGELSATKFRGDLRYKGGDRSLIEFTLDSDRLDLREVIGDGPVWRSWLPAAPPAASAKEGAPAAAADDQNILGQLRDDDVRATLRVGELLLPNIPAGKLDARFALIGDTLDVQQLDFAAGDAIALDGKGRIEHLSEAPSGRVDFALRAATTDSLRITSELFGLPESVSQSKHLSALAPLDVHVGLVAAREGAATNASIELGGKAGGSDIVLVAHAIGEPAKLGEAKIDIDGSVTGDRPQALLVLLFPNLPAERFAAAGGSQGKLTVKLAGVPNTKLTGKAALETEAMKLGFDGQGSVQEQGVAFNGKGSLTSQDASLALMLMGLEAPPSAAGVPLAVHADIVKQLASIDLNAVSGTVAGQAVDGTAHFDTGGNIVHFQLAANADSVSLPSLLGMLVAWQRSPSTEEMLGAIGAGASEVWPSRGFSLSVIENADGEIKLNAKQLTLGAPFQVSGASLLARVDKAGLTLTDLKGRLFGGAFDASGTLSPLGAGASLKAHAEIKGGKLEEMSKSVADTNLAKGPFELAFNVAGEGLSPPGLVAGLSGEGMFSLGAGSLQGLTPDPLRRVAVLASDKTIKVDKDQIAAEARTVREKLTKGVYKFAPT